ncbi:MAG: radical SAM protein [Candidatus Omnitrophica bacterium]|nr:radical SAM protein [Candidatus Omnitrophota bacterium]
MGRPDIPQVTYSSFSEDIHERITEERIPTDGTIELTYRCNLKCAHCYCCHDQAKPEMEYRLICRILDEVENAGCLWLLFTGGEPLLRPDFADIYTYAVKKGMLVTLFTNGTLITPSLADHLREYRPFSIEVTLYGATAGTYEAVTGVAGSFGRCMNGIRLLLERGLPLKLKAMVMTMNKHELPMMKQYADRLGLEFKFDPVISPGLDGSKSPVSLRISPDEIVELDLADEKRRKEWRNFCDRSWGGSYRDELFTCAGGLNSFHINPYGELKFCEMVTGFSYDLRDKPFSTGWHEFIPAIRAMKRTRDNRCKDCAVLPMCDQCPGWALLEHNDPEAPVDFLCKIAHLRAEAFGMVNRIKKGGGMYDSKEAISKT